MRYIVLIGWLYVVLIYAAASDTVIDGVFKFLFFGVFLTAVLYWLTGSSERRKRRRALEQPTPPAANDGEPPPEQ